MPTNRHLIEWETRLSWIAMLMRKWSKYFRHFDPIVVAMIETQEYQVSTLGIRKILASERLHSHIASKINLILIATSLSFLNRKVFYVSTFLRATLSFIMGFNFKDFWVSGVLHVMCSFKKILILTARILRFCVVNIFCASDSDEKCWAALRVVS